MKYQIVKTQEEDHSGCFAVYGKKVKNNLVPKVEGRQKLYSFRRVWEGYAS